MQCICRSRQIYSFTSISVFSLCIPKVLLGYGDSIWGIGFDRNSGLAGYLGGSSVMNAPHFLSFSFPLLHIHQTPSLLSPFHSVVLGLPAEAGYTDLKTIVVKFRKGLDPQIQNTIAMMAYGHPSDVSPEAWYETKTVLLTKRLKWLTVLPHPSSLVQFSQASSGFPLLLYVPTRLRATQYPWMLAYTGKRTPPLSLVTNVGSPGIKYQIAP